MIQCQIVILGWIARTFAIFSLVGASYVLVDILLSPTRRSRVKNKLVVAMASCDFTFSLMGPVLGLMMVPSTSGGSGTQLTCNIQGLLYVAAESTSAAYKVMLAITYLLIIKYDYSEQQLLQRLPWLPFYPMLIATMFCVGFPLDGFNLFNSWCTLTTLDCDLLQEDDAKEVQEQQDIIGEMPPSITNCTSRGHRLTPLLIAYYVGLFFSILVICLCMYLLYRAVLQREISSERFRFQPTGSSTTTSTTQHSSQHRPLSKAMRRQGLWYSGSSLVWVLPWLLYEVVDMFTIPPFWLTCIVAATLPSMGWLNAIVYFRPRYLEFRRTHPEVNWIKSLKLTLLRQNLPNFRRGGQPLHSPFSQRQLPQRQGSILLSNIKSSAQHLWTRVSFLKDPLEHPVNMNQYDESSVTVQSFPQGGGSPESSRLIRDANTVQQFVQNLSSSSNDDSSSSGSLLFHSSKEFVGNSDIENNNEDEVEVK